MKLETGLSALLVLMALTSACHRQTIFTQTQAIDPEGWRSEDFAQFEVDITDTTNVYHLDLHLRHDGRYRFSNLFLFINTTAPTGEFIKDTIECTLADPSGKWRGKGIGGQYQYTFPFKTQVVFPYSGRYRIEIEHGMRIDPLPWIKDIGLTISRKKN